jgi:hypothetical protein
MGIEIRLCVNSNRGDITLIKLHIPALPKEWSDYAHEKGLPNTDLSFLYSVLPVAVEK